MGTGPSSQSKRLGLGDSLRERSVVNDWDAAWAGPGLGWGRGPGPQVCAPQDAGSGSGDGLGGLAGAPLAAGASVDLERGGGVRCVRGRRRLALPAYCLQDGEAGPLVSRLG